MIRGVFEKLIVKLRASGSGLDNKGTQKRENNNAEGVNSGKLPEQSLTYSGDEYIGTAWSMREETVTEGNSGENQSGTDNAVSPVEPLINALIFLLPLLYWELIIRLVTGFTPVISLYPLVFIPAQGLLLATLCGWKNNRVNRILGTVILGLLSLYYSIQLIYYRIFGSLLSVSLVGMGGTAMSNFGWAIWGVLWDSLGLIALIFLPVVVHTVLWIIHRLPRARTSAIPHIGTAALCLFFWAIAILLLPLGGTGHYTAYEAYYSSYTDTDTSAKQLGAMTTTLLELAHPMLKDTQLQTGFSQTEDTYVSLADESEEVIATEENREEPEETADEPTTEEPEPDIRELYNILPEIDFNALEAATDNSDIKTLCSYYASQNATSKNQYTGLLEGYNVIYICAESFDTCAIHPDLTPTLYMLANNGIVLTNYYNSYNNTTTNGEFALMTGLMPDVSRDADLGNTTGSFNSTVNNYMPFALGNLMAVQGVKSYGYHGYYGSYYNREGTHPNLGYEMLFRGTGELTFTYRWPSSDYELIEQTVERYINNDRFNVYYMTFSGHGSYTSKNLLAKKNYNTVKKILKNSSKYPTQCLYYYSLHLELEKGLNYLVTRLEEEGKLDKTLIVIAGDHYPYYMYNDSYKYINNIKTTLRQSMKQKSTCIMYAGGLDCQIMCNEYCCNIDILPTVLNLLGLEYDSRLLSGTDVFSDGTHAAIMYDRSFITEYVEYYPSDNVLIWSDRAAEMSEADKSDYLDAMSDYAQNKYAASLLTVSTDYYRYVWENTDFINPVPPAGLADAYSKGYLTGDGE